MDLSDQLDHSSSTADHRTMTMRLSFRYMLLIGVMSVSYVLGIANVGFTFMLANRDDVFNLMYLHSV